MKTVLIPTDFSENSWNAIKYGVNLLKKTYCTFHIIHVSPIISTISGETALVIPPELIEENLLKESNEKLKKLLTRIEHLPVNEKHVFKTSAHYGFFIDHIKNAVKSKKIELIIMGTKGATGLKKVTIGSNTGNIITKVKCAVLAVPENVAFKKPKKIGFPTDFLVEYSLRQLLIIKELSLITTAKLHFLYVENKNGDQSPDQLKNKDFLNDYFQDAIANFHTINGKNLDTAIESFIAAEKIDMLVMIAKNLNFLERILFRPTVEEISYHTKIPFLVLHE
tara:strand:- start:1950 stop:2789 length:840 start_codon:yes stop_codon:yes gene_type:complete